MLSSFEEKEGYIFYKTKGLYTYQDMRTLIEYIDQLIEKDPNTKFLLDYSGMTNYEPKALKTAYDRIDKGFPKGVKIAIVYPEKGFFNFILNVVAKTMVRTAKFFKDPQEAKEWLLNQSS